MILNITLAVIYLVPLLSLVLRISDGVWSVVYTALRFITRKKASSFKKPVWGIVVSLNGFFGKIEYHTRWLRQVFGTAFLVILAITEVTRHLIAQDWNLNLDLIIPIGLLALTYDARMQNILANLKMAEFLRTNPQMHPEDFFNQFYQALGPFPIKFPDPFSKRKISPKNISFKKHKPTKLTRSLVIKSAYDTAYLAHLSLKTLNHVGKNYAREIFDIMASMWGKRLLELVDAKFSIHGAENLDSLPGKILLLFNHKSSEDFGLTFFALSENLRPHGRSMRPRFITAKDHFLENPLIYDFLGIGRLIETVDMVFLERKRTKDSIHNLEEAAQKLATQEIELVIYPQGTRAAPTLDRLGKRRDAGFYTTLSKKDMESDLAHLKKGTAFLATDTLMELSKTGNTPLHLVFIGIEGTATLLPRDSITFQTETDIEYTVGQPLTLHPSQVTHLKKPSGEINTEAEKAYMNFVNGLQAQINEGLKKCLPLHNQLKHRFLVDLQGQLRIPPERLSRIEKKFDELSSKNDLLDQILDRIYACPEKDWNTYLSSLSQILLQDAPEERYKNLRTEVSKTMLGIS